ncbi:MAG: hypothetical protein HY392_05110 [Candidatus Diapherotrites archaeon]|nr:hypothetical protein [Candidatus Diapherotrites archaeon]
MPPRKKRPFERLSRIANRNLANREKYPKTARHRNALAVIRLSLDEAGIRPTKRNRLLRKGITELIMSPAFPEIGTPAAKVLYHTILHVITQSKGFRTARKFAEALQKNSIRLDEIKRDYNHRN